MAPRGCAAGDRGADVQAIALAEVIAASLAPPATTR